MPLPKRLPPVAEVRAACLEAIARGKPQAVHMWREIWQVEADRLDAYAARVDTDAAWARAEHAQELVEACSVFECA